MFSSLQVNTSSTAKAVPLPPLGKARRRTLYPNRRILGQMCVDFLPPYFHTAKGIRAQEKQKTQGKPCVFLFFVLHPAPEPPYRMFFGFASRNRRCSTDEEKLRRNATRFGMQDAAEVRRRRISIRRDVLPPQDKKTAQENLCGYLLSFCAKYDGSKISC